MDNVWGSGDAALLALTAWERWSATRRVQPRSIDDYWLILVIALLLLVLVVLLGWVTRRRTYMPPSPARDLLADGAARRGLSARERQLLLVIVARSGLQRSHEIFITPDAFDQGAAKLLEQCARSRTRQESERLRAEVISLRERLAYRLAGKGGPAALPNVRDIPLGATVELLRLMNPGEPARAAIVIRNDELEIALETPMPVVSTPGEVWRVRHRLGVDVWQLDASTVSCEGRKLILNQGGELRVVEHDRRAPMVIQAPAIVTRFPFIQTAAMDLQDGSPTDWFEPVRGVVTQASSSSLEIRSSLRVQVGDRVLTVFALTRASQSEVGSSTEQPGRVVGHVGRVIQVQAIGEEVVMAVDMMNLTEPEIDELTRLVRATASSAAGSAGPRVLQGA